jgi:hypothetical protein
VYFSFIGNLNILIGLLVFSVLVSFALEIKRKPLPQPQ